IPYPENKTVSSAYPRVSVIDSGAVSHHSNSPTNFVSLQPTQSSVSMADGSTCTSRGIGTVVLQTGKKRLELENVKLTPDFDVNLVSVGKLDDAGYTTTFKDGKATVYDHGEVVLEAPKIDGLYQIVEPVDVVGCAKDKVDWHSRFGHPSENKLKALQKMYPQFDFTHPDHCDTCIMAKQRQLPYRSTNTYADKPLEIIHTDICEAKNRGYDGSQYFVLFVDDF